MKNDPFVPALRTKPPKPPGTPRNLLGVLGELGGESRRFKCALILAAIFLAACSKSAQDATLPVPAMSLDLSRARLLTPSLMQEISPDYQIIDPEVTPIPLIFGSGREDAVDLNEPLIVGRVNGIWKFVEMPSLNHTAWVYAGASYERNELWAILDSTPDSDGAGLYLLRSTDHGSTWDMFSGVRPPTLSAEFVGFTMDAKGHGRITVHQDDDTTAAPRGLYAYTSADGGKTWTGPAFTADDLISADISQQAELPDTIEDIDGPTTKPFIPPPPRLPPVATRPLPRQPMPPVRGRGRQ